MKAYEVTIKENNKSYRYITIIANSFEEAGKKADSIKLKKGDEITELSVSTQEVIL